MLASARLLVLGVVLTGRAYAQMPPDPLPVAGLPVDVTLSLPLTPDSAQADFERFAWDSFMALTGATTDGGPLWAHWPTGAAVLTGVIEPPVACRALYQAGMLVLTDIGKTAGLLQDEQPTFPVAPLIDQNGEYVRYETRYSPVVADSVAQWLSATTDPATPPPPLNIPCGAATLVQTAWKVLGRNDEPGRFYSVEALLYTPPQVRPQRAERCEQRTVGLVGLHLVRKTETAPQWVWASFEQIDNAPVQGTRPDKPFYNFHNWQCRTCPVNKPPPEPWNPNRSDTPTQVRRLTPMPDSTQQLNAQYQAQLAAATASAVWQYYELIGVQWPTVPGLGCTAPMTELALPFPAVLANTTLETYMQDSASCMECHAKAATAAGVATDFIQGLTRLGRTQRILSQ